MGHDIMYRIFFGDNDWHIRIGRGRTIIKLNKFTVNILPSSGFFKITSKKNRSKFQYIMMLLGGPLANLLSIILLAILFKITNASQLPFVKYNLTWFLAFIFWCNILQFIGTILPMKLPFNGYISDGMRILYKARETNKSGDNMIPSQTRDI